MRVEVIGAGPAGLYVSLLLKQARPDASIRVTEKNPEGVTWGWGVVFSDETLGNFERADKPSHDAIIDNFATWDAIDVHIHDQRVRSGGHGFCGIRRVRLLELLTARAREVGVEVRFDTKVDDVAALAADADLLIAADGVNSQTRSRYEDHFRPTIEPGRARFIWLGSTKKFDTFTFYVRENEHGLFQVHAYQFDKDTSTFIVECDEETWRKAGLHEADEAQSIAYCEKVFEEDLQGATLLGNRSQWISFPTLHCEAWSHDNVVIIGDAAHTAHFSIGSGTKLAMEDAIALTAALSEHDDVGAALHAFREARWLDVAKLQRAAGVSRRWFEEIARYKDFSAEQFTVSLLSRSKRVTHENLALRDAGYVRELDKWFARQHGIETEPVPPPMFIPYSIRGLTLENRVVVSPMCQYSATDGMPDDYHLVHYGALGKGGAGLLMTEMTCVAPEARISPGCTGIWSDEHTAAWRRIVDFVHRSGATKMGMQLGHAGRKGATARPWDGEGPLPSKGDEAAWPLVAPSPIPWADGYQTPKQVDRADMERITAQYVDAAKRAEAAGFDWLELHMAHGYLLAGFLSPLTNRRSDEYGGDVHARLRFPLEVFDAVRAVWPEDKPISVRISATDWNEAGTSSADRLAIAAAFKEHGCDLIDVSAGQTDPDANPIYGRMFQTPFSDEIRNEVGISTMAVGNIQGWDHVNTIIVSGRADLCAMARPHLYDPFLTRHAAAEQGFDGGPAWPDPYRAAGSVASRVATEAERDRNRS